MAIKITIIGGGPGGYVAAIRAAQLGADVTLIEKENLGGTCLNRGCIPSKIMKHSAGVFASLRAGGAPGVVVPEGTSFDTSAFQAHKDKVISTQRQGIAALLKRSGVLILSGTARISSPGSVTVSLSDGAMKEVAYDKLILATGTNPKELPGLPFDGSSILSSDHLLTLEDLPESMVIIGGGVIGCEFAFILQSLGVAVTVVEALDRILPLDSIDRSVSKLLLREMKKRKIKVLTETIVSGFKKTETGLEVTLAPASGMEKKSAGPVAAEKLAVCAGRSPQTAGLGLETISLETDAGGFIPANGKLETAVPGVYAIGDILGPKKVMLAHAASHEGLAAAENACGESSEMRYDAIPGAVFTSPETASVGITTEQAAARKIEVNTATVNFRNIGKAQAIGEIAGEALLISEKGSGRILGVHLTGPHATDLIGEAALAVTKGLTAADLAETVHPHPTLSEIFPETALSLSGHPLHG